MNRQGHPPQVYVIQNDVGACKIGVSGDPHARLAELRRVLRVELRLISLCQCETKWVFTVEHRAHRLLADRRLDGEWFNVSAEEATLAVASALAVVESGRSPKPGWSIQSVPVKTRRSAVCAARREGLTVGQWLERRVSEWEADGSPVPVGSGAASLDLAGLAQLLGALGTLPEGGLRRDAERTTRAVLRQARGLAPVRARPQRNAEHLRGLAVRDHAGS